jgi:hypothetical protein
MPLEHLHDFAAREVPETGGNRFGLRPPHRRDRAPVTIALDRAEAALVWMAGFQIGGVPDVDGARVVVVVRDAPAVRPVDVARPSERIERRSARRR